MASRSWPRVVMLAMLPAAFALTHARGDGMSDDDRLRLLYSKRFSFNRRGVPLITVEIMSGQSQVSLRSEKLLRLLPDGEDGSEVRAGAAWTVTARDARPGKARYHTVVSRQADETAISLWRSRGYEPRTFETGLVFGVEGEVIDARASLLAIAPETTEAAAARTAAAIAKKWNVETRVHPELVARPDGVLVARDDTRGTTVENRGVLWFAPGAEDGVITVADVVHGGGGSREGAEKVSTRTYRGLIYVTFAQDGSLTVVNAVPEDDLLKGIVPSEIFPEAPLAALQAQAVAARGELLSRIGARHFLDPFLLCSSQHCQVYGGAALEDPRTSRAVAETRGQVLTRGDGGGLVEIYYSSSCGGHTENNENVWGTPPDPALRGHLDAQGPQAKGLERFAGGITDENIRDFLQVGEQAFCGQTKYARGRQRWSARLAGVDVDRRVAAEHPEIGAVQKIQPVKRGISGRINELLVVGDRGQARITGELTIRKLLGGLRSSLFMVHREGADWVIDGAGFGHGVGLCQTGAIGMAEAGLSYAKILEHYYRGSRLRKLY